MGREVSRDDFINYLFSFKDRNVFIMRINNGLEYGLKQENGPSILIGRVLLDWEFQFKTPKTIYIIYEKE